MHSTLAAGLLPSGDVSSVDDVYAWLRGLLETVWRDPVCGDGVCESPFEYAQYGEGRWRLGVWQVTRQPSATDLGLLPYHATRLLLAPPHAGRFGCRADCGRLQDIQNLTAIRIDLAYDFSHPSGSIPATVGWLCGLQLQAGAVLRASHAPLCDTHDLPLCLRPRCAAKQELMQQASWNLCPAGDSSGCYWSSDQTFEQLSGSTSVVVPDVPDGGWQPASVLRQGTAAGDALAGDTRVPQAGRLWGWRVCGHSALMSAISCCGTG